MKTMNKYWLQKSILWINDFKTVKPRDLDTITYNIFFVMEIWIVDNSGKNITTILIKLDRIPDDPWNPRLPVVVVIHINASI